MRDDELVPGEALDPAALKGVKKTRKPKAPKPHADPNVGKAKKVAASDAVVLDRHARWLSVDNAKYAGYAIWSGPVLYEYGMIQPHKVSKTAPWDSWDRVVEMNDGPVAFTFPTERDAWESLRNTICSWEARLVPGMTIEYVCFEDVHRQFIKSEKDLNRRRGRVDTYLQVDRGATRAFEVFQGEWRRVVAELFKTAWPSGGKKEKGTDKKKGENRDAIKTKAVLLVKQAHEVAVPDDVAEAILIGHYFRETYLPKK